MFNSKLCVVTGGGSGIGKALCEQLVKAGAGGVYVVDISRESAQKVAASLPSLAIHHHQNNNNNFRCNFGAADVGNEDDIKRVIHDAWQSFGQVDIFFSNAGIMTMGGIDVDDVSNGQWEKIWNVNVMSHVFAARHLFPLWRHKKRRSSLGSNLADDRGHLSSSEGIFVITASAAGLLMQIGSLPYHVTKHAAVSVADWLAVHHYGDGVRVHCICPQAVQTNMLASSVAPGGGSAGLDGILLPNEVAIETIQAIERKQFLVLPHPKVKKYFERKASDYDRWLNGMRRVHRHFFSPSKI